MELMKNLRWICRVCTVNIKKRKSAKSAISILETPQLCEKMKKYLYIEIDAGDELPKRICGNCYGRIESFDNFVTLANKTENFLKDFINVAKDNGLQSSYTLSEKFQNEFASFAFVDNDKNGVLSDDSPINNEGDLILNVTVNDPLIKDIKNKIDLATKRKNYESEKSGTNNKSLLHNLSKLNSCQNTANTQPQTAQNISNKSPLTDEIMAVESDNNLSQSFENDKSQEMFSKPIAYDCLNLGSVIKDMDLLKLILKALKWSYTNTTLGTQIQRLKNTKLRDVITDPNLLQDTDMTQILRSYLSPVLLQSPANTSAMNSLSSIVSYKIPADTSVQLISVPSDGNFDCNNQQNMMKTEKVHRMSTSISPIILSDDSVDNDVQLFEVSVDPRLYFPGDKEFFFHQYNNTESLPENMTKPEIFKAEKLKSRTRKKHKKKDIRGNHLKAKRNRYEQSVVIPEDTGINLPNQHNDVLNQRQKNIKTTTIIQDDGFKDFDIDSITLVEEASGDDDIWAEFKVTETPDNSDIENHERDVIKKEAKDQSELTHKQTDNKVNTVSNNANTKKINTNSDMPIITTKQRVAKKQPENEVTRVKSARKNTQKKMQPTSSRVTRPKSPRTYFNKRKQRKAKGNVSFKSQQSCKTKQQKEDSVAPAVCRKSNARKRICKQCGLTFTNITDFVEHRKMHIM